MFARITNEPAARPTTLDALGMGSYSNPVISLSEFTYKKGNEIYGEKEPAEFVYQVKIGAVRSYKLLSDGRRQIGAFHLAGDIFGLENGSEHRFTAEAIVNTTVRLIKRRSLELVAESDALVSRNLLGMTTNNLQHAEDHMLLLGRKTSLERVAAGGRNHCISGRCGLTERHTTFTLREVHQAVAEWESTTSAK